MVAVFLVYGLAFFSLGLAVALESRRASDLPLGRQLPWLAAFGITHGLVEWSDMLLLTGLPAQQATVLQVIRTVLMPLSTVLLVRFGAGVLFEAGPLPRWIGLLPVLLFTPIAFLIAYALITATVDPFLAIDVWSRYLFYFSGSILAGIGFLRQRRSLASKELSQTGNLMLGAAVAFLFNSLVAGLIVPKSPYGLVPWLNYENIIAVTGIPVQFWRMISALAVTFFVVRALGVFEDERKQRLEKIQAEREKALASVRESETRFRTIFEMAPIGIDLVAPNGTPIQANQALQEMLGYSADELKAKVFTDYTHPDDVEPSRRLVQELAEGKIGHFRLEKRYIRKDGAVVWGNVAVSCVRNPAGELLYFIAMVEDITERKRIERALREEREQALAIRLQTQTEARQAAENWAMSLVEVSRRIANMDSVDNVLLHIVMQVSRLLRSDCVSIGLLDESRTLLELRCREAGGRADVIDPPMALENELLLEILRGGQPYRYPEDSSEPTADWYCPTLAKLVKVAAVVPMQFDGQLVGGLWTARFSKESFTPAELTELESMADQAVIALQHAHLAARMQSLAVMEERSRIAREMHDGLAQILGYLGLQMQTLEALVKQGAQERLLAELSQTRENIKTAQADVRESILSLRTTLAGQAGLVPALEEYVAEFGVQTDTETRLTHVLEKALRLSPLAEVQLVCIVQEALANVRKHAQAQHAEVTLFTRDGRLEVAITDDGIGFRAAENRHQFGLQTMRERAESVGGKLTVSSTPGSGTKVGLWLPLLTE